MIKLFCIALCTTIGHYVLPVPARIQPNIWERSFGRDFGPGAPGTRLPEIFKEFIFSYSRHI